MVSEQTSKGEESCPQIETHQLVIFIFVSDYRLHNGRRTPPTHTRARTHTQHARTHVSVPAFELMDWITSLWLNVFYLYCAWWFFWNAPSEACESSGPSGHLLFKLHFLLEVKWREKEKKYNRSFFFKFIFLLLFSRILTQRRKTNPSSEVRATELRLHQYLYRRW